MTTLFFIPFFLLFLSQRENLIFLPDNRTIRIFSNLIAIFIKPPENVKIFSFKIGSEPLSSR